MSPVLALLLCMYLIPLFISGWRVALASLAAQGFLLAWIAFSANPHLEETEAWLSIVDTLFLRGIALPLSLYAPLHGQNMPFRVGVLEPNILSWILVLGSVLLAFNFSALLASPSGVERFPIAVVASGILLGLLVLSTRTGMFGQMIGLIFIENAITLFELTMRSHAEPVGIHAGLMVIMALTIALYRWFLSMQSEAKAAGTAEVLEGPTI